MKCLPLLNKFVPFSNLLWFSVDWCTARLTHFEWQKIQTSLCYGSIKFLFNNINEGNRGKISPCKCEKDQINCQTLHAWSRNTPVAPDHFDLHVNSQHNVKSAATGLRCKNNLCSHLYVLKLTSLHVWWPKKVQRQMYKCVCQHELCSSKKAQSMWRCLFKVQTYKTCQICIVLRSQQQSTENIAFWK